MSLDKKDLNQIEKIIEKSAEKTEDKLKTEIKSSENRVIAVLSREITDLAEINAAVIQRVDKIAELEKRIIRIEHKIGIAG